MSDSSNVALRSLGFWSLISGFVGVVGVVVIGQASFGWVPGIDPGNWLRVLTGWMIPVGVVAALAFGVPAITRGSGRGLGISGLVLAASTVLTFIAYLVTHPY